MKKYILGIKDDQLNIAYAKVKKRKVKVKAETSIYVDNLGKVIDSCSLVVSEPLLDNMNQFFISEKAKKKMPSRTKRDRMDVIIGLESIISRTIEIPFLKPREIKTYIKNNVMTLFTVNMEEYFYDYKMIKISKKTKTEPKKITLMIVVIPRAIIFGIRNLVREAKFILESIKIYPDIMHGIGSKEESFAIVDMGVKKSLITIYEKGTTFLYTSINTNIDLSDELPFQDFVDEIEYLTDFYAARHQGKQLSSMYIYGNYQGDDQLEKTILSKINIPIQKNDQLFKKHKARKGVVLRHPQVILSQLVSKEIMDKTIDFSNETLLVKKKEKVFLPIHLFLMLTLMTAMWTGGYWYYLEEQKILYTKTIPGSDAIVEIQLAIDDLQSEKEQLTSKEEVAKYIISTEFDEYEVIQKLQEAVPMGVTIHLLTINKDSVSVSFNVDKNTILALELIVNINDLDYFEPINLDELELNDDVGTLTLQLNMKDRGDD